MIICNCFIYRSWLFIVTSLAGAVHLDFGTLFLLQLFQVYCELDLLLLSRGDQFLRSFPVFGTGRCPVVREWRQVLLLHPLMASLFIETEPRLKWLPFALNVCVLKSAWILFNRHVSFLVCRGSIFLWLKRSNVEQLDGIGWFGCGGFLFSFHVIFVRDPILIYGLLILFYKNLLLYFGVALLILLIY